MNVNDSASRSVDLELFASDTASNAPGATTAALARRLESARRGPSVGRLAGVTAGILGVKVTSDNYAVTAVPVLPIALACGATVIAAGLATALAVRALAATASRGHLARLCVVLADAQRMRPARTA